MNTTDKQRNTATIVELIKLKSTLFIPEMVELAEKKIRGNPFIVTVCTNNTFTNLGDYLLVLKLLF